MMSVSQTTWPLVWTCPALRLSSVISLSCSMSLLNSRPGCSCLDSTAMGNIHHGRFFLERCLGHSGATFFPLPSSCGLMRWCLFPWTQLVWTMKWKLLFMIGSQICWWNRISSYFKSVHLVSEAFQCCGMKGVFKQPWIIQKSLSKRSE